MVTDFEHILFFSMFQHLTDVFLKSQENNVESNFHQKKKFFKQQYSKSQLLNENTCPFQENDVRKFLIFLRFLNFTVKLVPAWVCFYSFLKIHDVCKLHHPGQFYVFCCALSECKFHFLQFYFSHLVGVVRCFLVQSKEARVHPFFMNNKFWFKLCAGFT